jgi:hypothetical protein
VPVLHGQQLDEALHLGADLLLQGLRAPGGVGQCALLRLAAVGPEALPARRRAVLGGTAAAAAAVLAPRGRGQGVPAWALPGGDGTGRLHCSDAWSTCFSVHVGRCARMFRNLASSHLVLPGLARCVLLLRRVSASRSRAGVDSDTLAKFPATTGDQTRRQFVTNGAGG